VKADGQASLDGNAKFEQPVTSIECRAIDTGLRQQGCLEKIRTSLRGKDGGDLAGSPFGGLLQGLITFGDHQLQAETNRIQLVAVKPQGRKKKTGFELVSDASFATNRRADRLQGGKIAIDCPFCDIKSGGKALGCYRQPSASQHIEDQEKSRCFHRPMVAGSVAGLTLLTETVSAAGINHQVNTKEIGMTLPVYELVLYTTKNGEEANHARAKARDHIRALSGFQSYLPLTNLTDPTQRADIVRWATIEAAQAAAVAVQNRAEFIPFMDSIASVDAMGHFQAQSGVTFDAFRGGVEVGFFRLKAGITEAQARQAHAKAVDGYLSIQPGWVAQYFIRLDDGLYLDLLFSDSRERAEALCRLWYDHPDCMAFAALVEDVQMQFGRVA
jgi:hypothetical protein